MKADIHPKYYTAKIRCSCGAVHEIGSTKESYSIDVCGACHPFYTGKQKLVDTAGRVEKFLERQKAAELAKAEANARNSSKDKKESVEEKLTRKAMAKEEAKVEKKEAEAAKKKEAAKKAAAKTVVAENPTKKATTKKK